MEPAEARALRNRLVLATGVWRRMIDDPLPKMDAGDPDDQIESFELRLVRRLEDDATPERAKAIADATWDLVHDRPDGDPVKMAVVALHERLALMSHGLGGL